MIILTAVSEVVVISHLKLLASIVLSENIGILLFLILKRIFRLFV